MMRIILRFAAFVITFGVSVTLYGLLFGLPDYDLGPSARNYDRSTAHHIKTLLRKDVANGRSRHKIAAQLVSTGEETESLYSNSKYRATVVYYVNASSKLSDAGLPADFQYAWRQHMKAWKKQAGFISSLKYNDNANSAGELPGLADNTKEINQTWYQVLRIAARYGVDIDRSYYQ